MCNRCGSERISDAGGYIKQCDGVRTTFTVCGQISTVGDHFAALLAKLGFADNGSCACKSRQQQMNRWGVEGCKANMPVILGWMREEAKKRNLPFIEFAAQQLVKLAIRRAEKELSE